MSRHWELVQVHEISGGRTEVLIRDRNSFTAYGGILSKLPNPRTVYPPSDEATRPTAEEEG